MKRILLTSAVLVLFTVASKAQQYYQVTHFMFDKVSINPASAGINDRLCASGIFRNQWTGFGGEPKTGIFNVHAPVEILRGGLGFTYYNDQLGFEQNNIARLSYSYHYNIFGGKIGVGVSAGIVSKSFDANWVTPDTEATDDQFIPANNAGDMTPDFNFGIYYQGNDFYVGLSSTHLAEGELEEVYYQTKRHYWLMAGYEYKGLMNGDLDLKPALLVKSDVVSTQLDINLIAEYRNMIWGGLTYRLADAIAPMVGYVHHLNNDSEGVLKIGYSYGVTTSAINQFSSGTHEIALNYCMKILKPEIVTKSKNPRFL